MEQLIVGLLQYSDKIGIGLISLALTYVLVEFVKMRRNQDDKEAIRNQTDAEVEKRELDLSEQQLRLIADSFRVAGEITKVTSAFQDGLGVITKLAISLEDYFKSQTTSNIETVETLRRIRDDLSLQLSDAQTAILNLPNLLSNHLLPARRFGDMLFKRGIMVCDKETKIISANHDALDLLGLTKEELLGRFAKDIGPLIYDTVTFKEVPPERQPTLLAISQKRPFNHYLYAYYHQRLERWMWLIIDVYPRFLDGEEVAGIVIEFFDVGELVVVGGGERAGVSVNVG